MSNIYFMMVVSYFYMSFSHFFLSIFVDFFVSPSSIEIIQWLGGLGIFFWS